MDDNYYQPGDLRKEFQKSVKDKLEWEQYKRGWDKQIIHDIVNEALNRQRKERTKFARVKELNITRLRRATSNLKIFERAIASEESMGIMCPYCNSDRTYTIANTLYPYLIRRRCRCLSCKKHFMMDLRFERYTDSDGNHLTPNEPKI